MNGDELEPTTKERLSNARLNAMEAFTGFVLALFANQQRTMAILEENQKLLDLSLIDSVHNSLWNIDLLNVASWVAGLATCGGLLRMYYNYILLAYYDSQ